MENFDSTVFSFFEDDHFIEWVTNADEQSDTYWRNWMKENPDHIDDLLQAKKLAIDIIKAQKLQGAEKFSREIWDKINLNIGQHENVVSIRQLPGKRRGFMVAASVAALALIFSAVFYFYTINKNKPASSVQSIASSVEKNNLRHTNSTSKSHVVYLVDGTKITLQPGASLTHEIFLRKDKREVYLDGDAFFDVAKDANRPFYVYAHDIVLRVLGTSFNVTTNKKNGNVTVLVKTGKVSVYKNNNLKNAEFILTPDESIRYTAKTQNIVKSERDEELLHEEPVTGQPVNFNFDEAPVAKIFSSLEEAYGIRINYDEELFSKCIVTTSLNNETFEEKLKIVCEAINAGYSIGNNEVSINGKGCK
ncbi:MAG TPA: FecR family protein [Puia sp.]|nr:FecR family protein [Puia sp.]